MYSGSPLSYSFAEANQKKFVLIIEAEPESRVKVTPVPLTAGKPLLRQRFESVDEAVSWLGMHPETWVELTMVSEGYLTVEQRKRLEEAHDGITVIIPEVKMTGTSSEQHTDIDLTLDRTELFKQYFIHKHGQSPNEELLTLFKEIIQNNIDE